MFKSKKAISFITGIITAFSMSLTLCASSIESISVNDEAYPEKVLSMINYKNMGEVEKTTALLNVDNEPIAYCIECTSGYMIYDTNGNIVEYSPTNSSPYECIDSDAYYCGPLSYYVQSGDTFTNIETEQEISSEEFSECVDYFEAVVDSSNTNVSMVMQANSPSVGDAYTEKCASVAPRKLNYNEGAYCGAMAATILLCYYDDNIDGNTLNSFFSNSPLYLFNCLTGYISEWASEDDIAGGVNRANNEVAAINLANKANRYTMSVDAWNHTYSLLLRGDYPTIVLIRSADKYPDGHWVVAYGIIYTSTDRYFIVNDSAGRNDAIINAIYQESHVTFNQ